MPLPVSIALAGQRITRFCQKVMATSSSTQVRIDEKICGIESRKLNCDLPQHVQRDEDRRQVQPRVAPGRQEHRVGDTPDPHTRLTGDARRAHEAIVRAAWRGDQCTIDRPQGVRAPPEGCERR